MDVNLNCGGGGGSGWVVFLNMEFVGWSRDCFDIKVGFGG